jgi:hypothetical protein
MDRRKFVRNSTGGLAFGASNPIELGKLIIPNWDNISMEEMNSFISQEDKVLDLIANSPGGGQYLQSLIGQPIKEDFGELFKGSMKSLLISGNFGSLSTDAQVHPVIQKRIWDHAVDVEKDIDGLMHELQSLTDEDQVDIKKALNEDPELGEMVLETLVSEAKAVGASKRRIRRLKRIGKRQLKKIKHSPGSMIEECTKKYEKLMSRFDSPEEMKKYMIANMGEKAFNKKLEEAEKGIQHWQEMGIDETIAGGDKHLYKVLSNYNNSNSGIKDDGPPKGLKLLGIGAIITASGWLLIAITTEGILGGLGIVAGVTVGPILIVIALIMLLVHAIRNSS